MKLLNKEEIVNNIIDALTIKKECLKCKFGVEAKLISKYNQNIVLAYFLMPNGEDVRAEIYDRKKKDPFYEECFLAYTFVFDYFKSLTKDAIKENLDALEKVNLEHWKDMFIESIERGQNAFIDKNGITDNVKTLIEKFGITIKKDTGKIEDE